MSAIYPEITIEWGGVEYTTKGTFKVVNKIEQNVSLAQLVPRMQSGDVPLSHLAVVYGNLLRNAGVVVSDEEVYSSMYGANDESSLTQQETISLAAAAISSCIPVNADDVEGANEKKKKIR